MGKSPTKIIEELVDSGCSINEAEDSLERAMQIINNIRTYMIEDAVSTSLKDAINQRENYIEKLRLSLGGETD